MSTDRQNSATDNATVIDSSPLFVAGVPWLHNKGKGVRAALRAPENGGLAGLGSSDNVVFRIASDRRVTKSFFEGFFSALGREMLNADQTVDLSDRISISFEYVEGADDDDILYTSSNFKYALKSIGLAWRNSMVIVAAERKSPENTASTTSH